MRQLRLNKFSRYDKFFFKFFFVLVILLFFSLAGEAQAMTYYVDATGGNDSNAGTSTDQAWKTIAKVNDFAEATGFSDGDAILFKRGEIWSSEETLGYDNSAIDWGTINGLTIGAYGSGNRPKFNGDTFKPIYINGASGGGQVSNLLIEHIDISGQDWTTVKNINLYILSVSGLIINDIYFDGYNGNTTENALQKGKYVGLDLCENIEVKNCNFFNLGPDAMPVGGSDIVALYLQDCSGTLSIHDNIIHDIESDAIQFLRSSLTPGSSKIYNNQFYNCGENSVDMKSTQYLDIFDNNMYREADFNGVGGTNAPDGEVSHILIHYTSSEACNNINIYENDFGKIEDDAIVIAGNSSYHTENLNIFRNIFHDAAGGIRFGNYVYNVKVYANVFYDFVSSRSHVSGSAISVSNVGTGNGFINNTVYSNQPNPALNLQSWYGDIKNNITVQTVDSISLVAASDNYKWEASHVANEWYLTTIDNTDPGLFRYEDLLYNTTSFAFNGYIPGTLGIVTHMGIGDNDSLGYDTYYVYKTSDPDSETDGYFQLPAILLGGGINGTWDFATNNYYHANNGTFIVKSRVYGSDGQDDWIMNSGDTGAIFNNPYFIDSASDNFALRWDSLNIDAGTHIDGITQDCLVTCTDYAGNPIYGLPDIGAYEYQPPYTMGADKPDIGADVRVYGGGKFRDTGTKSGEAADLAIIPGSIDTSQWLDVDISIWEKTGTRQRSWTEASGTITGNVAHSVGELEANKKYNVSVDGSGNNLTGCLLSHGNYICTADGQGKISFTYTGTYSTHTFSVQEGDNSVPAAPGGLVAD